MLYEDRKKEIETIKERTLVLKLSDADCDRILQKAASHGMTVSELLESFIGDLVDGTNFMRRTKNTNRIQRSLRNSAKNTKWSRVTHSILKTNYSIGWTIGSRAS